MDEPMNYALEAELWLRGLSPKQNKGSKPPRQCREADGRCSICGGDWSVCGCQGMLERDAASQAAKTETEDGQQDA